MIENPKARSDLEKGPTTHSYLSKQVIYSDQFFLFFGFGVSQNNGGFGDGSSRSPGPRSPGVEPKRLGVPKFDAGSKVFGLVSI